MTVALQLSNTRLNWTRCHTMFRLFSSADTCSVPSRGHVVLMPDFSLPLEYYLIPFLIIVGICLILIVVFMVGAVAVLFELTSVNMELKNKAEKCLPLLQVHTGSSSASCLASGLCTAQMLHLSWFNSVAWESEITVTFFWIQHLDHKDACMCWSVFL